MYTLWDQLSLYLISRSCNKQFVETMIVDSVVKWLEPVIVIDMVSVQNLLAPFCCVLGKDTSRDFTLLGGLDKQL